jgi:type III pantothenate kinase
MHLLLCVEVGNTNTVFSLMKEDELVGSFRMSSRTHRTSDEFVMALTYFFASQHLTSDDVDDVIICSVVPEVMHAMRSAVVKLWHKEAMVVGPGIRTGISIRADNPKAIGTDRIVNAAAVHALYQGDCIVVDFGTATTFDYVDPEGIFRYTIIEPGVAICANALKYETAKLPGIEIEKPKKILAKDTVSGIQAGVVYGYIGSVEAILTQMKKELKKPDCHVVATGGLGRVIAPEVKMIEAYDPHLAAKGLRMIYDLNRKGVQH